MSAEERALRAEIQRQKDEEERAQIMSKAQEIQARIAAAQAKKQAEKDRRRRARRLVLGEGA